MFKERVVKSLAVAEIKAYTRFEKLNLRLNRAIQNGHLFEVIALNVGTAFSMEIGAILGTSRELACGNLRQSIMGIGGSIIVPLISVSQLMTDLQDARRRGY